MKGPTWRLYLALGLLSIAIVAFQLALMQLLSLGQWHHFAYMVISVALLGFGASGTVIALARNRLLRHFEVLLPALVLASAAAMAAVWGVSQGVFTGFDSYLLFLDAGQAWRLLLTDLLLGVPFFLGALAIGLVFVHHVDRIGHLYFANLLGSGLGGLTAIALLGLVVPQRLPAVVALFALAGGILLIPRGSLRLTAAAALTTAAIAPFLVRPPLPALSEYKDLRGALELPGARVTASRPSPYGMLHAVSGPALRHAPGLSLSFAGEVPAGEALFCNGNWFGAIPSWPPGPGGSLLDHSTAALPYALTAPERVLVLHSGTGLEVAQALEHGAGEVTAVEPHRAAVAFLLEERPASAGTLLRRPEVTVAAVEPRAFLATDAGRYDLILKPPVGAFGGEAGLFALQEQHTLTLEGVGAMWRRLAPDGLFAFTVWLDYPARAPLRLAATLATALEAAGIGDPSRHLVAVRGWGTVTFCVKRSPFTAQELATVRAFCETLRFDPLLLPGLQPDERERFHLLGDRRFFADLDALLSPEREALYAAYPFRLRPASDDRPFFSQSLRWRSLPHLTRLFGERSVPFLEMGYLIVVLTFVQMTAAALPLIVLPLLRIGWRGGRRLQTLTYFGGLGLGYMLVEIVLIHRFVLYLGHPVHAAATVICAVLVCSGAGSLASSRLPERTAVLGRAAGAVAALLLLYALLLPPLLEQSIALPLLVKGPLTLVLLGPLAFAMGMPFPLGLKHLSRGREDAVPWAWGINGSLSVLSTAFATILAVEAGFTAVFLVAAACYLAVAYCEP